MRFRRKQSEPGTDEQVPDPAGAENADPRHDGPWDVSEVEIAAEDPGRIDLGGLIVAGLEGIELQLQVDEQTNEVAAVLLANQEGAVELRPFAAPRHGDIWEEARRGIAAEIAQLGGTATEDQGPYGPELRVVMPVQTPDGQMAQQPSRIWGISGPRWLLRATLFGRPALEPVEDGDLETALRAVVVRRGTEAMPPGEALPLVVPEGAVQVEGPGPDDAGPGPGDAGPRPGDAG